MTAVLQQLLHLLGKTQLGFGNDIAERAQPVLAREQFFLVASAVGDVVQRHDRADLDSIVVIKGLAAREHAARRSVLRRDHHLDIADRLFLQGPEERNLFLLHPRFAVGQVEIEMLRPFLGRDRFRGQAVEFAGRAIEKREYAVGVAGDNPIGHILEKRREKFLFLAQRFGRLFAFRDVADDAGKESALVRFPSGQGEIDREFATVPGQADQFDRLADDARFAAGLETLHPAPVHFAEPFRHDEGELLAEDFVGAMPEDFLCPAIPKNNFARAVRGNDGVADRLGDGAETQLRSARLIHHFAVEPGAIVLRPHQFRHRAGEKRSRHETKDKEETNREPGQ